MATSDSKYFKRVGHIEITDFNGGMKSYYGSNGSTLDFKFHVKKPLNAVWDSASISILGLPLETITSLTAWMSTAYNRQQKRRIKVFAGYENNGGENVIFDGYIIHAIPTSPPEMWLNIEADSYGWSYDIKESSMFGAIKVKEAFQKVADLLGVALDFQSAFQDKIIHDVNVIGTASTIIKEVSDLADVFAYIENDTLKVVDRTSMYKPNSDKRTISTDEGMLAIGGITYTGISVTHRLDSTLARRQWLNVQSDLIKSASSARSGLYFAYNVEHIGHFRGEEWFTKVDAWATERTQKGW